MKVLVTGANGYLGQGIVAALLNRGSHVIATDVKCNLVDSRAEKREVDLFSVEDPYVYFDKPDIVLHLAWRDGFVHNSDAHIDDLPKHYKFLMENIKAGVKQIAVMGSMHEIGFFEGCVNENTACHPMSLYGIGKNTLREIVTLLSSRHEINMQWLRGYYIVGNSKHGSSIFSKITAAEARGDTEFPFTMGQNQYDFLDYEEFCHQVVAVVLQNEINGIINICSGRPEKLADRVERFLEENQYSIKLKYGAFPDRPYDSKAIWGDDAKIQKILGNNK